MPFYLPGPTPGAGAPEVDDGLAKGRLTAIDTRDHEDWAGVDQYGHDDDGKRIHFVFELLTDEHEAVYADGDPVVLEKMTRTSMGKKSNFYAVIKSIMTAKEFALWEAATPDDPVDVSFIIDRVYDIQVSHNKNGWPQVETVVGIAKPPKGAK